MLISIIYYNKRIEWYIQFRGDFIDYKLNGTYKEKVEV